MDDITIFLILAILLIVGKYAGDKKNSCQKFKKDPEEEPTRDEILLKNYNCAIRDLSEISADGNSIEKKECQKMVTRLIELREAGEDR